jgi:hypothetical protein
VIETEQLRAMVLARVDFAMEQGEGGLDAAVQETVAWLRNEKLIEQLFDEVGAEWIRDVWTKDKRGARRQALTGSRRVHDLTPLTDRRSIYEALYEIEGQWKRLGDLLLGDVEWLEYEYRDRATHVLKYADYFEAIAKRMEGGQTVRDAFSEEELRALFERV